MSPERWQKIVNLLEAAADLGKDERSAFLDEACAGDDAMRKEVESLLASDDQAEGFIESPALGNVAELIVNGRSKTKTGQRANRHDIVDLAGAAGIGEAGGRAKTTAGNASDEKMNRVTLRFSGDLEAEFCRDHYQKSLKQIRYALLIGTFLYAIFGLLDRVLVPEVKGSIWVIRYAIVCPVLLLVCLLSFWKHFNKAAQSLIASCLVIGGLGIIAMTAIAKPPGSYLYYAGLILVTMFACTFTRLRVPYAAASSLINIIAYELTATAISQSPPAILANNSFFLIAATVVGMSANYSMEFYMRRNFLQRRTIEARTKELQEKNEELVSKNCELVQSREELLRSTKRTELVFAALSEALPGTVLDDKYRLEEKIGSGGFGTVYRATHLLLESHVAVKVFRPSIGADPLKDLERFRLEGISACRVHHANAVSVIDFGVASSIAFLVMELLTGCSLKDELDKEGIISVSRSIRILQPICSALAEAHAAGIIHRDVKPSNIFLHSSKDGEIVKVVDFGVAKLMADTLNPGMQSLTETGSLVGTPLYMSPERLTNKPYDGQADVYSIGVMAYEMLCGRLPFESSKENYWSVVLMQVNDAPLMPRKINPEIPEKLEQLIMAALSKSPDRRPTARELGRRFAEFGIVDSEAIEIELGQPRVQVNEEV